MNLLRRIDHNDELEVVTTYYKCTDRKELFDFIQENRDDITKIVIDTTEGLSNITYIVVVMDCIVLSSIEIIAVR